ncbi:putative dipeptidase [Clostridium acetireducens DSM 10703]|uniref:Putative dipeptidase n=1 Tax=Clostridium acetireducens DSM 10703 TaxID=1121290 RepID=A0A1E8EZZ0_9CLOT|nr:dipeptidase PepV [Clostridium acetireducens]OFI06297.1 putative dipeptidase [Clostridium acetireducens DSM 10703]
MKDVQKQINNKIDEIKEDLILSTQEIIKIRSVEDEPKEGMPFGEGVAKALEYALDKSYELGFKIRNMNGYIGYAEYGEGEDYVAVLGHLDVVPEGDGWKYPPYGAEIHDGKMYGRGTLDDKAPIIAALYGLKAIKDLNLPLSKKVRIIFGTNEESGCGEMPYYMEREKPPVAGFTPDGQYPIIYAEKGILTFNLVQDLKDKCSENLIIKSVKGGQRPNMVPDYCEAVIWAKDNNKLLEALNEFVDKTNLDLKGEINGGEITIKSYGVSAHGSTPEKGKNAIMNIFKFLGALPLGECDLSTYINFFNSYVGTETNGKNFFGKSIKDKPSGELSFNVGKVNIDEEKASLTINMRYPVTYDYDYIMNLFNKRLIYGIKVEDMQKQKPLYFSPDNPLINALQKVYTVQTGEEAKLLAIGGGTYAKEMPNIVAFGPIFPGKPDLDHQVNEYIEIVDLIKNAKIYGNAIYELAK